VVRLVLDGVEQTYPGTPPVHALRGVSVVIEQGTFVAIEGPSGGGKSSLLNIIGLLDAPSEGTYLIDDDLTSECSERHLAELRGSMFSFIFQSFHLLDRRPVIDSVELGLLYRAVPRRERRALARRALEEVGLGHLAYQPANKLSGGERQRVAIARALASQAPVVVADEPTGNLDSTNGRVVVDLLRALHDRGATVVLVTHDHEVAKIAPAHLYLRDGMVERLDGLPTGRPQPLAERWIGDGASGTPSRLRVRDLLHDAWASVRSRKGRTAGLVVAVAVGVALAVSTLGLSDSARAQVAETFDAHENRQVTVAWGGSTTSGSLVEPSFIPTNGDALVAIEQIAGVDDVAVVDDLDQHEVVASLDREPVTVALYSAAGQLTDALSLDVRWPSATGRELGPGEVLIGATLADRLELGPLSATPVVLVDGREVSVVGIIESADRLPELMGAVLAGADDSPSFGVPSRTRAFITTGAGAAQQVGRQVPYVVDPAEPATVGVEVPVDPRDLRASVESDLRATLLVLTAVALLASVIGLANAMVLSVLERRQEFGLRRAIGARPRQISALVLLESALIGAVGGVAGLVAGLSAILGITLINRWSPVFDLAMAPFAVLGGVVVGAIGGVLAATRASRIRPSDALRQ
jgi:macrolide transport system ATP-binding/permease protein